MIRGSGVLLHISSLPSPYGIGSLGKAAYDFVDFLRECGVRYWQMLPLCMVDEANSPYCSYSAFGGNPLFIDLDFLVEEGFLFEDEIANADFGSLEDRVEYEKVFLAKFSLLEIVFPRFMKGDLEKFAVFCEKNHRWLEDYSLFMALKERYDNVPWQGFPKDIRDRKDEAIGRYRGELWDRMDFYKFVQFKFFEQWERLRSYANGLEVSLIGDVPMYVSEDSVDTWANREVFQLDENGYPLAFAGVPPDYFSKTGQFWGNPLYDWKVIKEDDYFWWKERLGFQRELFDVVRIDHFRGFESYWSIPYNALSACEGSWVKGPDRDFVEAIKREFSEFPIIAEDLGSLTSEVKTLLRRSEFCGMKVLQFAFNPKDNSEYLPHRHVANCVVYTGTHDNDTLRGFIDKLDKDSLEFVMEYFDVSRVELLDKVLIRAAFASVADLAMVQMQDILRLGSEARMNTPSTIEGNWTWRMGKDYYDVKLVSWIKGLNEIYGRG